MIFGGIYGVLITLFGTLLLFSMISIAVGNFSEVVRQLQEEFIPPLSLLTAYGLIIGVPAGYAHSLPSARLHFTRCLVIVATVATLGATIFGSPASLTGGAARFFYALIILALMTGLLIPIVESRLLHKPLERTKSNEESPVE